MLPGNKEILRITRVCALYEANIETLAKFLFEFVLTPERKKLLSSVCSVAAWVG